jgi:hypothetical protein
MHRLLGIVGVWDYSLVINMFESIIKFNELYKNVKLTCHETQKKASYEV